MKSRLISFAAVCAIVLLLLSCKKGDSGTDPGGDTNQPFDVIKTTTITSSGGTIDATDLSLTIPPNSVSGSASVTLSSAHAALDVPSAVTKLYKLESPSTFNVSYVKVKYTGTLTGNNYIVWQEDSYIKSAGKMANTKFFIPARDSSGYLVAKLSDLSPALYKSQTNPTASATGLFYALTGQGVLNSASHFKVYYPSANSSQAQDLATYLETAYTLLQGYGFNFIGRDWPADIYLQKFDGWLNSQLGLDNNAYGYYMTTTKNPLYIAYRTNNCAMYFNLNLMGDPAEMRATAGHEFFHAVQDLYDPRDPVTKKWNAPIQTWLDEASAVWFESKMNTGSALPVSLSGNELAFTEGMHITGSNAQNHGYGMAPMIKYIASLKGTWALASIYTKINTGAHPVDALFATVNGASGNYNTDWFNNFLKSYLTGGVYGISTISLGNVPANRRYESKALTDTLCTFPSVTYPDFSGQLYFVSLTYSDIVNKSVSVNLRSTLSTSRIHVFQYANSVNTFLKSGTGGDLTLTPGDVKAGLVASGNNKLLMLILVTNNDYHSGFQGSTDIGLTAKINYNAGPTIALQPDTWSGGVNSSKMFSLTTSNLPARYRFDWNWGDGNNESSVTTPSATHTYRTVGAYTITVNLVDLDQSQTVATATGSVIIANNPAHITPDASEGLKATAYNWTVVTDYTLTNARYEWDFGDGSSKIVVTNNKAASHTYANTGNYTITCDVYNNATGVKVETATTTFKVSEVSALLAAIKSSAGISMNTNVTFSNGTEYDGYSAYSMSVFSNYTIPGATIQTFTWTGINTFTATRSDPGGSTPTTITVNGTVSLDGQTVTLEWLDHSAGTGSSSWYLSELKVSVVNMPLTGTDSQTYTAQFRLSNSTQFTGYYKQADFVDPHNVKTYSGPRPSTITIEFLK